jgi:signal transduction histidine kinase
MSTCGEIMFGYSKGILLFSPKKIKRNTFKPYIAFVNFQLFNKNVPIGNASPLNREIDDMESLTLNHKQNFFSIEFAALDYADPGNIQYAYKLEGVDNDWIYVQKQRIANYTNLPKGKFVFCVKSTNSNGIWVDNERRLPVEILPSFWETPSAYFLYFVLTAGLIILSVYILITIYRLKDNVKLEKKLAEMKLRFFTDISHEIRTPLTMITAPIDFIIHDKNTPENIKNQLGAVFQNTNRLLRMVNQIMDFRKIQFLKLKVQETEISPFIAEICKNFKEVAKEQRLNFMFKDEAPGEKIWIDRDCVEKIVFNLLSNAFKYTPAGKNIEISTFKENDLVYVQVKDEGKGIPKEKQKILFTRFASFNDDKSKPSTGIGLSMVKDLSDKHGAKISFESEAGNGSCFKIGFQKGFSHFDKNTEIIAGSDSETTATRGTAEAGKAEHEKTPIPEELLRMDDIPENLHKKS